MIRTAHHPQPGQEYHQLSCDARASSNCLRMTTGRTIEQLLRGAIDGGWLLNGSTHVCSACRLDRERARLERQRPALRGATC